MEVIPSGSYQIMNKTIFLHWESFSDENKNIHEDKIVALTIMSP